MNTATEIASRAVEVAGTLSTSMEAEMCEATERDDAFAYQDGTGCPPKARSPVAD